MKKSTLLFFGLLVVDALYLLLNLSRINILSYLLCVIILPLILIALLCASLSDGLDKRGLIFSIAGAIDYLIFASIFVMLLDVDVVMTNSQQLVNNIAINIDASAQKISLMSLLIYFVISLFMNLFAVLVKGRLNKK